MASRLLSSPPPELEVRQDLDGLHVLVRLMPPWLKPLQILLYVSMVLISPALLFFVSLGVSAMLLGGLFGGMAVPMIVGTLTGGGLGLVLSLRGMELLYARISRSMCFPVCLSVKPHELHLRRRDRTVWRVPMSELLAVEDGALIRRGERPISLLPAASPEERAWVTELVLWAHQHPERERGAPVHIPPALRTVLRST